MFCIVLLLVIDDNFDFGPFFMLSRLVVGGNATPVTTDSNFGILGSETGAPNTYYPIRVRVKHDRASTFDLTVCLVCYLYISYVMNCLLSLLVMLC